MHRLIWALALKRFEKNESGYFANSTHILNYSAKLIIFILLLSIYFSFFPIHRLLLVSLKDSFMQVISDCTIDIRFNTLGIYPSLSTDD